MFPISEEYNISFEMKIVKIFFMQNQQWERGRN